MMSINPLKLDFRIKVGYGAAVFLLLISYILTFYANNNLIEQSKRIVHTNKLITHLTELVSYMKDAETGIRGYFLRKDKSFLEPYNESIPFVAGTINELNKEIKNDSQQLATLQQVKSLIDKKYGVLSSAKSRFEAGGMLYLDSSLKSPPIGKFLMDTIRMLINTMKTREQETLVTSNNNLNKRYVAMNIIIITSLILAILFALFGLVTYMRENKARKMADEKVIDYQAQLQNRIEELDIANKELVQMRRTEKFVATGRIARTIAHEVRNPLTNIDLAVGQIKAELSDDSENLQLLFAMVSRNSRRINQLITELLNATRFVELDYHLTAINAILDSALDLAHDRIELNHIRLNKQYASDLPDVAVDPDKIKIVFLNIIVNAVEAMKPNEGILTIRTRLEEGSCIAEIVDNGIGMDAASLVNLFEPYYTTKSKGNGLGLTNAQNIILNHKGSIHVESKPGEGTTFIIKFNPGSIQS